jgi:hypothetical protein
MDACKMQRVGHGAGFRDDVTSASSVGYVCQLRTGHVLMSNLERPRNTGHVKSVAARNRW